MPKSNPMQQAIAILEDDERRLATMRDYLSDKFPFFECVFFRSAPEAIAWLRKELPRTVLVGLDHDLEPSEGVAADPGTGRDVADLLARQPPSCPVLIHSTNNPAAIGMMADLEAAGWPVGRLGPYGDLAWIAEAWLPLVRDAIVNGANALAGDSEGIAQQAVMALTPPTISFTKGDNTLPAR
jgi:hypothetical protein